MFVQNRIMHDRTHKLSQFNGRDGFTLIEMLVSVALILIMMSMFATIFQLAGGSISKMRGMSENDQRSRTLQTVIKADFDKRTFRYVYPFAANENTGTAGSNIGDRQGYFYISENNPYDGLDDVLQFTVMSTLTMRNTDTTPYYGQALNLAPLSYPNQPDADDAQITPNNTGSSTVAEICYFVRNGNLYRRQLMLRDPIPIAGTNPQPSDGTISNPGGATTVFANMAAPTPVPAFLYYSIGSGSFWNDYDYSAYYTAPTAGATFVGINSINNSGTTVGSTPIAKPFVRFGFSPLVLGSPLMGRPREFITDNTAANQSSDLNTFLGRFTMQECSDLNFHYPQSQAYSTANAVNYIPTDPSYALTINSSKVVSDFTTGLRRGEDLIMANVHAFDIQVWDEAYQGFVNIGDPALPSSGSDYAYAQRYATNVGTVPSPTYGPRASEVLTPASNIYAINAVFDTWHPSIDLDTTNDPVAPATYIPATGQTIYDDPPFRPVYYKPASVTGNASDVPNWQPGVNYTAGQIVFPSGPPGTYLNNLSWGAAYPPPPSNPTKLPSGYPFYYRCVQSGYSSTTTNTTLSPTTGPPYTFQAAGSTDYNVEPSWPQVAGATIVDKQTGPTANNNYWPTAIWQAVDNRKPLKAIKIQIRVLDTSSQQMRQVTIIQSLVD